MIALTKELKNDLDLNDILYALDSRAKRTMPVFFLNGDCGDIAKSDIKSAKTKFNFTDKENELKFMILPATFTFPVGYSEYADLNLSPEAEFMSQYVNRLRLISCLPEEILSQVKDKRLLALGYAEKNVKKEIIKYAKAKNTAALNTLDKSLEASSKAVSGLTIESQFSKHPYIGSIDELLEETTITAVNKQGNDLYIELDDEDTFVLTDVKTLEEEINPEDTAVELFELHKTERGYELHLLLKTTDKNMVDNFSYVTYGFKDMALKV